MKVYKNSFKKVCNGLLKSISDNSNNIVTLA